jgi:hypothetical protein
MMGSEVYADVEVDSSDKIELKFTHDFAATPWGFFGMYFRATKHDDTPPGYWRLSVEIDVGITVYSTLIWFDFDQGWFPIQIPTGKATVARDIYVILERV